MGFVTNIIEKLVGPRIENRILEYADLQYYDKRLKETVHEHLLNKYGNEVFYNSLDSYIATSNVLDLLIKSIRGESSIQPRTEHQFKSFNAKRFIEYNPEYKHNKVISSKISALFSEIFNIVYTSLLSLNPHADYGKLQRSIEISSENILANQQTLSSKLDKILENMQPTQPLLVSSGIASVSTEGIGKCSEKITQITENIKDIEKKYQKNNRFNDALSHYYSLLQNIAITLIGSSREQVNTLLCTLYCNIALCQVNLGFSEKALESLSAIPSDTAAQSKVYHLVYALIHIQKTDTTDYRKALHHAERSLEIDPNYHSAFSMKQLLLVYIDPQNAKNALLELDTHYCDILTKGTDSGNIAEYYQTRGLINMHTSSYSDAIEDYKLAESHGYNPVYTKMNIAVAMYGEAVEGLPKGRHILLPPIKQNIMMKTIDILKKEIDMLKGNADYDDIRKRAVIFYASSCALLGKKHDLVPIADYIYEGEEYEKLRIILLGAPEKLTDSQFLLLEPEDRLFYTARDLVDSGNKDACKKYILELINAGNQHIPLTVYHILLQLCLINNSSSEYWKYRDRAKELGLSGDLLDAMDAYALEIETDILHAKEILDRIATSSVDDNILNNVLRFYLRNNCTNEARSLFLRTHELIASNSMYTENAEAFYGEAINFFISIKDPIVEKILTELPTWLVSTDCRLQLHAAYYCATNNPCELFNCMNALSCATGNFPNAFNTALCATRLFMYDDALNICYDLENRTVNSDDKIKLLWLISDILLLHNDLDNSYLWAKKAHDFTSTNPYDRSHQAFFARAFRCNHQEALKDIIEYKEEHPIAVKWLHKFSISQEEPDVISCIEKAIDEFDPGNDSYQEHEKVVAKLYKQGIVPINMLLKRYNWDLIRFFDFASEHKLRLALGDFNDLMDDSKSIGQALVVDALTLVIIAYHGYLSVFDSSSHVYVNYGSIALIQQLFLAYGFTYLSDILSWLQTSKNIVFEADGFIESENQICEVFSSNFIACCKIASAHKIPFLHCDLTARRFQQIPALGISSDVNFVSIPSLFYKSFAQNQEELNNALYSLLKNSTFINFNAETILHQVRKNKYNISTNLMAPFMVCSSSCDMHSFASVYLAAISTLKEEQYNAAVTLCNIVLEDATRVWRQGTYDRYLAENFPNTKSMHKSNTITEYVCEILQGINLIFDKMPDELTPMIECLSRWTGFIPE